MEESKSPFNDAALAQTLADLAEKDHLLDLMLGLKALRKAPSISGSAQHKVRKGTPEYKRERGWRPPQHAKGFRKAHHGERRLGQKQSAMSVAGSRLSSDVNQPSSPINSIPPFQATQQDNDFSRPLYHGKLPDANNDGDDVHDDENDNDDDDDDDDADLDRAS